jgi:5-dehydro-2-deoxygluconokinase
MALAIDHRSQMIELAEEIGVGAERIAAFKRLAVAAAAKVANGREGFGMLIDQRFGRQALHDAAKAGFSWIGRPVELPGSRPLRFEHGEDIGSQILEWPVDHCIKCLCFYRPDDPAELKREQQESLLRLFQAARGIGRELLIEIIAGKNGPLDDRTIPAVLEELYALGVKPDWWKLEPQASSAAWKAIGETIERHDPWCRGVVLLGLDAPREDLEAAFTATVDAPVVKGFAVGRTIFADAARAWLSGSIDDAAAIDDMAERFRALTEAWARTRGRRAD